MMHMPDASGDELAYHLQRSFTPGDQNYDAQLRYARQLFINGDGQTSQRIFEDLSRVKISNEIRTQPLYPLQQRFVGAIARMEASYAFIKRDGDAVWIFLNRSTMGSEIWNTLEIGVRVSYLIAFNFRGPIATDLRLEGF